MDIKKHFLEYKDLYLILLSWPLLGFILPGIVVAVWSLISFLLILRTGNSTKALLALLAVLIFSDSYLIPLAFASIAKIAIIIALFIYLLSHFGSFRHYNNRVFVYFLPFLVFSIAASAWSSEPFTAIQKSLSYAIVFFVVPLYFQKALSENEQLGRDLIISYSFFLLAGIILWLVNVDAGSLAGRFRGLMGNPNGMGTLITVLVMMVLVLYQEVSAMKGIVRSTWLFFGITVVTSLLLCGSRTALFAILLFIGFTRLRYFSNFGSLVLFLTILFSYNYLLTNLPVIVTSLGLEDYLRIDTLEEGSGRFVAWNFALEQIQNKFFAGGGFGYTDFIYKQYYHYLSLLGHQGNAHNSYLTIWLDTGLIGIILFAFGMIRLMIVSAQRSYYALPVFYASLFSANFESWLTASLNPFTSLLLVTFTVISSPEVESEIKFESEVESTSSV